MRWSRPSSLPRKVQTFTVGEDGTVSVTTFGDPQPQVIGNIQTADFINPAGLQAIGNNLFLETGASGAPQVGTPGLTGLGTVLQNTLENSNVSVVEEMVNMITTQRAYEMNSKASPPRTRCCSFITQKLCELEVIVMNAASTDMNLLIAAALGLRLAAGAVCGAPAGKPDDPYYAPGDAAHPAAAAAQNNGAIYQAGFETNLYDDRKAFRVGDIITITLNERTQASKNANAQLSKDSNTNMGE